MAYTISAYGSRRSINEAELIALTRDEVFDMLEYFEDRLKSKQKELAYIRARAADRETQNLCEHIKNALVALDAYWESIRNSSVEEFYIDSSMKQRIENEGGTVWAFFSLLEAILYKCTVTLRACNIEYTLEGAKLKIEEHPDDTPCYICFRYADGTDSYTYDTLRGYDEAIREIDELNKDNRFFRCKECGKIVYIAKSDDEWKKAHGLQPVQRCKDCIKKRKAERK